MKKQFNRMRQLANQTVGRAEKTEVLSDDLLQIERRLDSVRMVCHNSHKKLLGCLQGQPGTDTDKRFKKLPLMGVSQTMIDGCNMLNDDTLLVKTLLSCGEAEQRLAQELSQHEVQIEKDVLEPLNHLAEVEIPNIQKQRKQLAKLVLDWDSARTRYNQTQKSLGMQMQLGKMDSLKEEVDEAANKVEQCKDQLAADMYNFVSKEGEYGQYFVTLLEAQADYHRKALAVLEKALPEIQAQQDKWTEKPAFGTPLEEHLKRSGREIALPIEACVMMLLETGMKEEGLFRIAAGASKLKKLKAALDCSTSQLEEFYSDPHAVAGALKSYLRELPEPLMTFSLYDDWIQAGNISDPNSKLQALWMVCQKLPKPNQENFRYLVKFLAKLSQSSDVNKMTPSNIAIVLGPNLLWAKHEGTLAEIAAATSVHVVTIIEPIIQHADWFFPEEVDFNVSNAFVPVSTINQQNSVPDGQYEFGVMERKRPYSMAVVDGDFLKKEGISLKLFDGHLTSNSKRGGTLNRKHGSPPFQPPLPPTEASGQADYQSPLLDISAPASVASTDPVPTHVNEEASTFKPKEPPTSTTPPLLRNGGLQPSGGSASQLAAVPAAGAANPSPHSLRRATKKPAPAPPKPVAPLPVQPGNQGSPVSANTPPSVSPKPSGVTHSPASTAATASQGGTAPHPAYSHGSLPRRLSGSQPLIHAPSHPPPQPPTQPPAVSRTGSHPVAPAAEPPTTEQSPSPPHSPTPPDTPPLGVEQPGPPEVAQTLPPTAWTGTLTRGRPVPKPRIRPSVPPPPQPPGSHNTPEVPPMSSSKIITDPAALNPQVQPGAESAAPPADAPPQNPSTVENDIESTAL